MIGMVVQLSAPVRPLVKITQFFGGDRTHVHALAGLDLPQEMRERILRLGLGDPANIELDRPFILGRRRDRHRPPYRSELGFLRVVETKHAVLPGYEPWPLARKLI